MNKSWRSFLTTVVLAGTFMTNPFVKYISMGLGILLTSLPVAKSKTRYEGQTYAWNHAANKTATDGTPMPVIYGKTRVKPVLKNRYIRILGNRQYLYALYGFACHKIDEKSTLSEWSMYPAPHVYQPGDEVTFSSEPGKTYICKYPHVADTTYYLNVTSGYWHTPLFSDNKLVREFWKTGKGSAAITSININGRNIDSFSEVEYETRPGLAEQAAIVGFDRTYSNDPQDTTLNMSVPFPLTQGSLFTFSMGVARSQTHYVYYAGALYLIEGSVLGTKNQKVYWTPPASTSTVSKYALSGTFEIINFNGSVTPIDWTWKWQTTYPTLASDWVTVDIDVSTTQNIEVSVCFPDGLVSMGTHSDNAGKTYEQIAHLCMQYRKYLGGGAYGSWMRFPKIIDTATHEGETGTGSYGVVQNIDVTIVRKTTEAVYLSHLATLDEDVPLEQGQYQVRVAAIAPAAVKLTNVAAITYGDFTYPGEPLLAIKALASDKLSGDIEVTAVCDRSTVWVHNETDWVRKSADNPAWAAYDLLVQGSVDHPSYNPGDSNEAMAVYGCGVAYGKVDYTSFNSWAAYLNSINYKINTVFDSWTTVWDAVLRICSEFRGMVSPVGARFYAITDKPQNPTQLLCTGNILAGTFRQTWPNRSSRAGSIEVVYFDQDRGYEEVRFLLRGTDWQEKEIQQVTLYGTVRFGQAYQIAKYIALCNELLLSTLEFSVSASELQAGVGDVVWVQHELNNWGMGGRIVEVELDTPGAGQTKITLDKTLTFSNGKSLRIYARHALTDALEEVDITVYAFGNNYVVTDTAEWAATAAAGDIYAIGEVIGGVQYDIRKYRIVDVKRSGDLNKVLTLLEYDADVYTDPVTYPDLGLAKTAAVDFNVAQNVLASEKISIRPTGEYEPAIEVVWLGEIGESWGEWEVVFRDVDASDCGWDGEWDESGSYDLGQKVYLDGKTYMSLIDGNTTKPISI